jgi:hypothetical protein
MKVYYAVWHHRYGEDVIINETKEGRLRDVCHEAVVSFLGEIEDDKLAKKIGRFIDQKNYSKALKLWGEAQVTGREEYVEFGETKVGP